MKIIKREDIEGLSHVTVEGKIKNLGLYKDLRKNNLLKDFIPEQARLSMAWVRLLEKEILEVHQHPTASMVIITAGQGRTLGDISADLEEGDIVLIPAGANHGFIGQGQGFWGISIQFEHKGLYEDPRTPRVKFLSAGSENIFQKIIETQETYEEKFRSSKLMKLLEREGSWDKEKLFQALNAWSDWFQKLLYVRAAFERSSEHSRIAVQHFQEEIGHNEDLFNIRTHKDPLWDPLIESVSSWFFEKMLTGTSIQRLLLMHFVLEGAGDIFYRKAASVFPHYQHFTHHAEHDAEHFQMGMDLLKLDRNRLEDKDLETVIQGWRMMILLTEHIAILA